MRKRKVSASEALALLNAAPKQQMNYGGRLTAREQVAELEREERAKAQAELDRQLAPQIQEQARTLSQLREKERRETRLQLMFKPSFDFDAPVWVPDGSTPDQITHNIGAALYEFRQGDGANLSDADLRLLKEFLQINRQKDFDCTNPQTWALAQQFIESKLNPVEPEQTEIDLLIETVPDLSNEPAPETAPETLSELRSAVESELVARCRPVYDDFYARIERESGVSLTPDQQRKIIAFMNQRGYEGLNKPQAWMNALWHLFPEYLPESERLERQERIDRETLPMDEYKKKYNLVINTSPVRAYADRNARD